MLPTIVIGADEATRDELNTRWRAATGAGADGPWFFDTAEEAVFRMTEELGRAASTAEAQAEGENTMGGDMPLWSQAEDSRWEVNVLWGPGAWGFALSGHKPELAHTGWTGVFGAHVDEEPERPRRVLDGTAQGVNPDTRIWQAATMLRAHVAFDVYGQDGTGGTAVKAVVELFASRDMP